MNDDDVDHSRCNMQWGIRDSGHNDYDDDGGEEYDNHGNDDDDIADDYDDNDNDYDDSDDDDQSIQAQYAMRQTLLWWRRLSRTQSLIDHIVSYNL